MFISFFKKLKTVFEITGYKEKIFTWDIYFIEHFSGASGNIYQMYSIYGHILYVCTRVTANHMERRDVQKINRDQEKNK